MSECVASKVRSYFLNGTLPEAGTVCQSEKSIFDVGATNATGSETGSAERRDLNLPSSRDALDLLKKNVFARMKYRHFL